ncbi:MAG: bifunctional oligoribonuclease/PAP phosphatase NrnA [Epsilonproteobacteria bacterium]|nr:MAG: bifunctional oligoribonuclease/PAP phosphatase NrnA [Campylobacterota bacterium]
MQSQDLKTIIDNYHSITILSHINPDADAIGTSLGIYTLLKAYNKRVEVVNHSTELPQYLDFLPNFSKIKHQIDYKESLIITCNCGSIDRTGFDLTDRVIINIDHHQTNQNYGTVNLVDPLCAASSQVAYILLGGDFPISKEVATCFYTALLSDTRYFTTSSVDEEVFAFAVELIAHGADHQSVTFNLTQRHSLASLRVLEKALETLTLHHSATVASMQVDQGMIVTTGARVSDLDGIVEYACSLTTVEIGIILVQHKSYIKVSLRSKNQDITPLAEYFGGGGHRNACGFTIAFGNIEEILDKILKQIELLNNQNKKKQEKIC